MVKPRFTVIIPTLNEEKFLPNLLASLTRQTVKDYEVIVVDGASKDTTRIVAKKFSSKLPKLTVIPLDSPGVSKQRNFGAREAKADWLVFVDADSVLLSNCIERIGVFIDRKKPLIFTTWLKVDSDEPAEAIAGFLGNIMVEGYLMVSRPWAPGPLTVVKKTAFFSVGGYDEDATFGEDHDLGMKLFDRGIELQILREILYVYSLRRYRREGNIKTFDRYVKSTLQVLLTRRGPKHMVGFESGGHLYTGGAHKRKKPGFSREMEKSLAGFFREFMK